MLNTYAHMHKHKRLESLWIKNIFTKSYIQNNLDFHISIMRRFFP